MAKRGAASRGVVAVLAGFVFFFFFTSAALTPVAGAPGASENVVPVLGGLRALTLMTDVAGLRTGDDFFVEYCRNIARRSRFGRDPAFGDDLDLYTSTVAELYRLSDRGRLELSIRLASRREATLRALQLLGWRVKRGGEGAQIRPGDDPGDAVRIRIPGALGWDALGITRTLSKGGSVSLVIPSGSALVRDAQKWAEVAGGVPAGGYAQLFARNPRIAMAYVGLDSMGAAAAPLVKSAGLRRLVGKHAEALWLYGDRLALSSPRAAVPGGPSAEAAWERLAGASATEPGQFFRVILEKEDGRLVSFYTALAQADAAHQRYFTQTAARLERFYRWFKATEEPPPNPAWPRISWKSELLRDLPLDKAGRVRFPGGQGAWTSSAELVDDVLGIARLNALVPVARLELARRAPLDEASARLLAAHYSSWQNLFPHFEKLPKLGREDFEALAAFESSLRSRSGAALNTIAGEWFSLVKLIELGALAGSLTPEAGAQAFRRVCQALASDAYSAQAIQVLRALAGSAADLDEGIAANLLRLSGDRRAAFNRIKRFLGVPPFERPIGQLDQWFLMALSGVVYAALLDADLAPLKYDPLLLTRHNFADAAAGPFVFDRSGFQARGKEPAYFSGGFMLFEEIAASLPCWGAEEPAEAHRLMPTAGGEMGTTGAQFSTSTRLVEVYASVTDARGRYLNGLDRSDFKVLDNGQPVEIQSFEGSHSQGSVALLLDTTGSMRGSLSVLKLSALRLIDELRPADSVGLYAFNETLREVTPFTTDKDAVRRAVLGLSASGGTALHDALAEVAYKMAQRPGKKAIVLFSDGVDTASILIMDQATSQAKLTGAPVYTVAYGEALNFLRLGRQLEAVARATGGLSFTVRSPREMEAPFRQIAEDLIHGYVLAFKSRASQRHEWRTLETILRDSRGRTVRAREGYYPD